MAINYEEIKTNIPLLDNQHTKYFNTVEQLFDLFKKKQPNVDDICTIIEQVNEYAIDNFDTEEYLMELEGYPETEEHKAKHETLKDKLDAYNRQLSNEDVNIEDTMKHLRALLVGWFYNQIKDDDMRLAAFLHARKQKK